MFSPSLNGRLSTWLTMPLFLVNVGVGVLEALDQAETTGIDDLLLRHRVANQRIGRGKAVDE